MKAKCTFATPLAKVKANLLPLPPLPAKVAKANVAKVIWQRWQKKAKVEKPRAPHVIEIEVFPQSSSKWSMPAPQFNSKAPREWLFTPACYKQADQHGMLRGTICWN